MGKDQALAAHAGGDDRRLLRVAYGDDGDLYIDDEMEPIGRILDVDDTREQVLRRVAAWVGEWWTARMTQPATVVIDGC